MTFLKFLLTSKILRYLFCFVLGFTIRGLLSNSSKLTLASYEDSSLREDWLTLPTVIKTSSSSTSASTLLAMTPQTLINNSTVLDSSCVGHHYNSQAWLESHFQNIRDDESSFLLPMADDYFSKAIKQTFCHKDSAFLHPQFKFSEERILKRQDFEQQWMFRLIYLGIHLHQHAPAFPEMQMQQDCPSSSSLPKQKQDYECKDTKYLVTSIPQVGMGASIRMGAVPTLLAGLAMNRTVVLINGGLHGPTTLRNAKYLKQKWKLAGCPGRTDYQCFFLPLSTCTPSEQDLEEALVLPNTAATLEVWRTGKLPNETMDNSSNNENVKVVIMPSTPILPRLFPEAQIRAGQRLQELIRQHQQHTVFEAIPKHLFKRLSSDTHLMYVPRGEKQGKSYNNSRSFLHAAALLYILRLNSNFKRKVDTVFEKVIPPDHLVENSFGMPIRASDKCGLESSCLTFEQYMNVVVHQRNKYFGTNITLTNSYSNSPKIVTNDDNGDSDNENIVMDIILTSESANMMAFRKDWEHRSDFPFRFVYNSEDVTQGSGSPRKYGQNDTYRNDVMVHSFVALKMQLLSKHFVANCCSSFHVLMMDLIKHGCGAFPSPTFHCMQELPDPYRICCAWTRSTRCQKQMATFKRTVGNIGSEMFF